MDGGTGPGSVGALLVRFDRWAQRVVCSYLVAVSVRSHCLDGPTYESPWSAASS